MLTQDCSLSKLGFSCEWVVKEKRNGIYVPVLRRKNIVTNTGLTALAGSWSGTLTLPQYMVLESNQTTVFTTISAGATSVTLVARVDQTGDTKLVLSAGTGNQETVTFTGTPTLSGGHYIYTLSAATTHTHTAGDFATRQVLATDTMTNVSGEFSYDTTVSGTRNAFVSAFSPGTGQYTYQFYFTGIQATQVIATVGLSDSQSVGAGNLFNHLVLGYDHTIPSGQSTTNDVEIDVTLTASNV